MKIHPSITAKRVLRAARASIFGLKNPGFCIACGASADNCEPDAEKYACKACDKRAVYGAVQINMLYGEQLP